MKHILLNRTAWLLLLTLVGISLEAQIPAGYYNNASGKQGDELKSALHDIIKGHTVVSYAGLLNAFAYTDCKPNGTIWDIYSNIEYSPSSGVCGDYEQEGDCWNREHTWPQSWFNGENTPRTDLFHVYPTDGYVNGQRSNYPYGEVNNPTYTSGNGSKLGPCVTTGYTGKVFEPIDEYKGDIARSYFYMSVRYVGEDENWSTSGMTDKSEIKPWAIQMLLNWSDNDPVSQKEIDRNNAVYGYQGNRNPFIDHPEYARMIWDENWQGGSSYNITCATGLSHGSVSAPETALEGSTVSITATPSPGYMVDTYTVYKTGSPSTTVAVSSNGTFTMPSYAVTVSATFKVNNTFYNIALGTVSHGSISTSINSAKSGTTINLTAAPNSGYSLYSWYVFKQGDMNTTVAVSGNSFVMPAFNVTVMATFVSSSSLSYVKVTTESSDWSGEYLIVCESQNVAFNGTVDNKWGKCSSVTISNATIESNATTDGYKVIISQEGNGYKFKFPDNKYMSWTTAKTFAESTTAVAYSISLDEGNAIIAYGDVATLQYNDNSGNGGLRSYASAQTAIQLYKKTANPAPTHSINFNNNGGSNSMPAQTVNEFEPTALNENTFVRENFVFDGWNTQADGSGTYYADGATVRLLADLTLYAQWLPLYTVTISGDIVNGSVSANVAQALEEQTITLTATPETGYELGYWVVTASNGQAVTVTENQFEMPASHVTVSAVFTYVGVFEQKYYLVTNASQLVAGRTYLIVNTEYGKALGKTQNTNNRSAASVTITNNSISTLGDACELTLGGQTGAWTFYDATNNSGYLYAAGGTSTNNYLRTQATLTNAGKWTISLNGSNEATIKTIDTDVNRHTIMYNNSSALFSCYASGQKAVCLFIRSEEYEYDGNTTLACLNTFDKHTVHSGVTLTANTVLGTAMLNNPNNLVIEDGAQFIHNTAGVQATVKKNISAYSTENGVNNGWHLISYPHTGSGAVNEMTYLLSNYFDLYYYDEPTSKWMNQEADANNFTTLEATKGYLYANSQSVTLGLKGTLETANATVNVPLSYTSSLGLAGFNLVGNPFAHNVTSFTGSNVAENCYRMNDDGSDLMVDNITTTHPLKPAEGFFVKALAENASITFNSRATNTQNSYIALEISENGLLLDRLIVTRDGQPLEKLSLNERSTRIFATRDHQDWAVVPAEGNEQVVNFKAAKNGSYTLAVNVEHLDLDYLHLIDNLTGTDLDLLHPNTLIAGEDLQSLTPTYTFNAKTTDYASRFKLVFVADNENGPSTGSGTFAFISNGNIIVNGEGTLQIIDATGRVILSENAKHCVSTAGMAPGVYILRLVTKDNTRTQKIVIW